MKIAIAIAQSRLGYSAKISCNSGMKSTFAYCVHANDFADMQKMKRVLLNLINIVRKKNISGFKLDILLR